ncbi:CbrC family protein [Sphingobacterium lactis]|uniref:CbrC family protein n=1 Tax=Sphingobacterium lactis TaxID=797291 RepID=UPI003DA60AF1
MELPKFKYSPNAYTLPIFEEEEGFCSACNENRNLRYNCSFYSIEEPEYICPWCIENGKAAETFEGEFNDYEGIENSKNISKELLLAVSERTPSYPSWQQEVWLTHCNQPCAFIGFADYNTIEPFMEELQDDINNLGIDREFILRNLRTDGRVVGYLFQCLNCKQHRLHVDSD